MEASSSLKLLCRLQAAALVIFAAAAAALLALRAWRQPPEPQPELKKLVPLPDFSLVERSGRKLTLSDLRGKVWVADFIFTSCSGSCPILTTRMQVLQERLKGLPPSDREKVRLVSFSVDARRDTPERLAQFAQGYRADPELWYFATGAEGEVIRLAREAFMLPAQRAPEGALGEEFVHSSRLVLVDQSGAVRAYYEGVESPPDLALVVRDLLRLAREGEGEAVPEKR